MSEEEVRKMIQDVLETLLLSAARCGRSEISVDDVKVAIGSLL